MTAEVNAEQLAEIRAGTAEQMLAARERSLEAALGVVGCLFDRLEGDELRDGVVRVVAELEREVRIGAMLAAHCMAMSGIALDDARMTPVLERVVL